MTMNDFEIIYIKLKLIYKGLSKARKKKV